MKKAILILIALILLNVAQGQVVEYEASYAETSYIDKDDANWYKEGHFWVDPSDPWDIRYYGMVTNNKFDIISNTCGKIVYDQDTSEWAYQALEDCAALLSYRVRWPYWMDHEKDPNTRIGWRSRRLLKSLHLTGEPYVYGHRKRMSRDPFVNFYAACIFLEQDHHIENIKIPWYLYRPGTWQWRNRLIEDDREDYRKRLTYLYGKAYTLKAERWTR